MHITRVILKDGKEFEGTLWEVRPTEGWFSLAVDDESMIFKMDDCASVITEGERISKTKIGDCDDLAKWRQWAEDEKKRKKA